MNLITLATTIYLLIGTSYGTETESSKSLNANTTILPRNAGFRFEDDIHYPYQNDNSKITFEDQYTPAPFKFEETTTDEQTHNTGPVVFQDDNRIEDAGHKKKKRRRRRKPRYQGQGQYPGVQGPFPGFPGQPFPGEGPYPYPVAPGQAYPDGRPGFGPVGGRPVGQFYRPPRRPKQSFAFEALSRVTEALTSIALYDDYQCVPRLLCEAAGGGALGSSNVLQSAAGLQPLLTLLSTYSGISSSPLFVFGRAVFLGMTSKGNTASCRYAYPQCPTDPEQLVHYLNNHNGGFFRFFNSPQQQIPQNLEQFYTQLSGYGLAQPNLQNHGLHDAQNQGQQPFNPQNQGQQTFNPQNQGQQPYNPQNQGQQPYNPQLNQNVQFPQYVSQDPQNNGQYGFYTPQYGLYDPQLNYPNPGQQFAPQNLQASSQPGYYQPGVGQQNYGLYSPQYQAPQPNLYGPYDQFSRPQNPYANKYGYGYHKKRKPNKNKYGFGNANYKDNGAEGNKIQKRIQNTPNYVYVDSNTGNENESSVSNFNWIFPGDYRKTEVTNNIRGGKNLKFPDGNIPVDDVINDISKRKVKSIIFPESQNLKYVNYDDYSPVQSNNFGINYQNYKIDSAVVSNNNYNNYGNNANEDNNQNDYNVNNADEVQTVYIVRDDPNNPEIVKVRKGQKVY